MRTNPSRRRTSLILVAAATLPYWITVRSVDASCNHSNYQHINFTAVTGL